MADEMGLGKTVSAVAGLSLSMAQVIDSTLRRMDHSSNASPSSGLISVSPHCPTSNSSTRSSSSVPLRSSATGPTSSSSGSGKARRTRWRSTTRPTWPTRSGKCASGARQRGSRSSRPVSSPPLRFYLILLSEPGEPPLTQSAAGLVLIASYERLRNLVAEIGETEVGLLLADEGHRLKNYSMSRRVYFGIGLLDSPSKI